MKANLKSYKSHLKKLESEYEVLKMEASSKQQECSVKKKEIQDVKNKIEKFTNKKIHISEHAILRYLERVVGFDMDKVRAELLTESVKNQYEILGNGAFPINKGLRVVIKDNVVVTVK